MEPAYLNITTAAGTQSVIVGQKPVTIGRHGENTVVLLDVQASRFHCVIARSKEGNFLIRDLDSRNGTLLNGKPIKTALLNKGDVVTIGSTRIQLVEPRVKGAAEEGPAGKKKVPLPAKAKPPKPAEEEEIVELTPEHELPEEPRDEEAEKIANEMLAEGDEGQDLLLDLGASSGRKDDEKFLPVLAESLGDKAFPPEEIALLSARGQVVHPAASQAPPRERRSPGSGEAVSVLRYILLICVRARATDIHIEPKNDDYQLRLRIDGNMVDIVRLTKPMGLRCCTLVKILSEIDVQFRDIIQEGHFSATVPGRRIDYRVSFAPSLFGQKLVVRVLDTANAPLHLPDMHLPTWMLQEIQKASGADQGMILVVGPTGSGKTTTLYATLRDVGVEHRNVVTIEDPVEIEIPGVTQVPVNEEKGSTFANILRSMLRQDPDVMMVGEVRDNETASIALQAAMTGHLVLSTLHAKDTIGAVFRLLDLKVEPYLVSSALQLVISQRLIRQLCPYCKKPIQTAEDQLKRMSRYVAKIGKTFIPTGCPRCLKTGFAGRRAIFEMLIATPELRETILKNPSPKDLEKALTGTRYQRLVQTGYQMVVQGITSLEEVERALGPEAQT